MNAPTRYRVALHVAWQIAGGEVFLVDLKSGEGLGLNRTASYLWMRIAEEGHGDATVFASRYEIPEASARADIASFIDELLDARLIESVA